ncbi:hypothetical protein GGS20DRAFT_490146 [Poronia punctata]|nr:hypothetical protein GGS20DRAFT_490146 [Poronia punctata]
MFNNYIRSTNSSFCDTAVSFYPGNRTLPCNPSYPTISTMNENDDASLQPDRPGLGLGRLSTYDYRQVWPPLEDVDNPEPPPALPLPMGMSADMYIYTFSSMDMANYKGELAEARRRNLAGPSKRMKKLAKGWYRTLPWWSMFVPATVALTHLFHFWVAPLVQERKYECDDINE